MDNDSPVSRVERTLWTVWTYITEAVNRFFRPEPADTVSGDSDSEPANCAHVEGGAGGNEVDEELHLVPASLLSSSRPAAAWRLSSAKVDLRPNEECAQYKTQPSRGGESKASEEGEGLGEEAFAPTGNDDAGLLAAKDAKEGEEGENGDQKLRSRRQDEVLEKNEEDEEHVDTRSLTGLTGDTERAVAPDDSMAKIQVNGENDKVRPEDEQDLKPDTATHEAIESRDSVLQLAPEPESKSDEGVEEVEECKELPDDDRAFREDLGFTSPHGELQMAFDKSGIVSEDEVTVAGQERAMARTSEEAEDGEDGGKDGREDGRERGAVTAEENVVRLLNNQAMDEVLEQGDDINMDILTLHVARKEEVVQNAKMEVHTAKSADGEQEDVAKNNDVQAKTIATDDVEAEGQSRVIDEKSGVTTTGISVGGRLSDKDQVEESYMEIACTTTSVAVKPEGQEISGGFKNIPLGVCEGRAVVSQEQNSSTCEETQERVPEYNNEPWPDENTTQRFLEVGDSEHIQAAQLPEEAESKEPENLQNNVHSPGADYLKARGHMEEERESTEDIKNSFDSVSAELPQETETPLVEAVIQESGHLLGNEEGKLLVDSMRTGIEHSEEEFESNIGLTEKTDEGTEGLQDGTEVEFEIDERLCDSKEADAAGDGSETTGARTAKDLVAGETLKFLESEVQEVAETSFSQESVDAMNSEPSSESEPVSLGDGTVEMHDAGISMEERGDGVQEEAAEDEIWNRNEMDTLIATLSVADELMTTKGKPNKLTGFAEETVSSVSGRQDVSVDLWMRTLSEDTENRRKGPEPGPQTDEETEPSNEEQEEISLVQIEKDEEQLVESNSGESESTSDTEVSSSTAESGFGCCGNSETQLLKLTNARSLQEIHDMLADVSESADELSTQLDSGSQELSVEETSEMGQSHLKEKDLVTESGFGSDPVEARRLKQDSDRSQEEETDKASQKELTDAARETGWEDAEGEDVKSATEKSALFEAGGIKIGDEPLEMTVSDSPDEARPAESARSRSGSEASFEEKNVSTESGTRGAACAESDERLWKLPSLDQPQPKWSEHIADSLPALNRAGVTEQPATRSEDRFELDACALDFTMQKWRIAVKNPDVRPPKDPRSLLHMPSVDPTPTSHLPAKVPAGVLSGGLGTGIKLPGLGAGFPVLRKTQRVGRDESSPGTLLQEPETKPEKSHTPKQDEAQHKPKWMPPRHPGFGNPLMSELKTKLKKTTKD